MTVTSHNSRFKWQTIKLPNLFKFFNKLQGKSKSAPKEYNHRAVSNKRTAHSEENISESVKNNSKNQAPVGSSSEIPQFKIEDKYQEFQRLGEGSGGSVSLVGFTNPNEKNETKFQTTGTLLEKTKGYDERNIISRSLNCYALKKVYEKDKSDPNWAYNSQEVQFILKVPYHDNLVQTHDIFIDSTTSTLCIVTEAMQTDLFEVIHERNRLGDPMSLKTILNILKQIINGLLHLRSHGWSHRDLKPENILLSETKAYYSSEFLKKHSELNQQEYIVKIADYGASARVDDPLCFSFGTVSFLPPEAILLMDSVSFEKLDTWGIACIALEMIGRCDFFASMTTPGHLKSLTTLLGTPRCDLACDPVFEESLGKCIKQQGFDYERYAMKYTVMRGQRMDYDEKWVEFDHVMMECLQWNHKNRPTLLQLSKKFIFRTTNVYEIRY